MMLVSDSKPIKYEQERADIRGMLERLNIGIGQTSQGVIPLDSDLINESKEGLNRLRDQWL